ncbi:MAG TPA: ribosome maturation factor RimP [Bdellovibrionales bacterium]|nr:ribosome maturation factor RimP [Bdellovibrionales bacterium]
MSGAFLSEIRRMAEEVSNREGCYLYDLEFVGTGGGRVLRVTIDKEAEGGASIDDCSNVSRGLNLMLDVEDVIPGGQYQLEVSSPGLERVLKEPRHYQRAVGQTIAINSFAPLLDFNPEVPELGKAKRLQGKLVSFDDKGLKVGFETPGAEAAKDVFVPFESVTKAHVVFEFQNPAENKPGKGPKKGKHKK